MKLLTKEIIKKLPKLYSQETNPDPMVVAKFFTPDANWTWYVIEGSPEQTVQSDDDYIFFGLVVGLETELGNFALSDLQKVRGKLGLPIERDMYWTPKPLSEVRKLHARR